MDRLGHTAPKLTLPIYACVMRRDANEDRAVARRRRLR
jgi:hypothetical protein